MTSPQDLWQQALNDLRGQMVGSTFDAWLRGTQATGIEDGTLIVNVKNEHAADWLENRLNGVVARTMSRLDDTIACIRYVVENSDAVLPDDTDVEAAVAAPAESSAGVAEILEALLDKVGDRDTLLLLQQQIYKLRGEHDVNKGSVSEWISPELDKSRDWLKVHDYESVFWGAYLGSNALKCWMVIIKDDKRRSKTEWTPPKRYSAPRLAEDIGCGRQTVSGVWRRCEADHPDAVLRQAKDTFDGEEDSEPKYYRRQQGLLERLEAAGIAHIKVHGTRSRKTYEVSVKTNLGFLSPEQVATLPDRMQTRHDRCVEDAGYDPDLWH